MSKTSLPAEREHLSNLLVQRCTHSLHASASRQDPLSAAPEVKSFPRRFFFALAEATIALLLAAPWVLLQMSRRSPSSPVH